MDVSLGAPLSCIATSAERLPTASTRSAANRRLSSGQGSGVLPGPAGTSTSQPWRALTGQAHNSVMAAPGASNQESIDAVRYGLRGGRWGCVVVAVIVVPLVALGIFGLVTFILSLLAGSGGH